MRGVLFGWRILAASAVVFSLFFLLVPQGAADSFSFTIPDPNIIGFGNATSCGGSVICAPGNQPFLLSQISSWFSTSTSSPQYLVQNNLGAVSTLALTVTGAFQATNGPYENFQCEVGAPSYFGGCTLTGPGFVTYTQGPNSTSAAANFSSLPVTFKWSGGKGIPSGATFLLTDASWVNNTTPVRSVPEPSSLTLFATSLIALAFAAHRSTKRLARTS